ncbi:MAG: ABC transporter substrate-binding protein, partial [Candidatus Cloacimonadota bacterium]|nr:ABC transporter substrate-binding protein [Candidatus Cloacimonadota bacterium]
GCYFWILSLFRTSGYRHFWRSVQDNIHSFDNNIQSATNKFISGEASVLLTTFSRMQKIKNQYAFKEVIPDEGAFGIVYQVALTQFGEENNLSKKFLEFLLDRKIQIKLINKYNLVSALDSRRKVNSINCPSFNIDKSLNLNKKVLFEERERWLNYLQRIFE